MEADDVALQTMFFFFNDTATTEIYTLSLHDALPIFIAGPPGERDDGFPLPLITVLVGSDVARRAGPQVRHSLDRKSTRLNSSHANISYAVFCLKKKKQLIDPVYSP